MSAPEDFLAGRLDPGLWQGPTGPALQTAAQAQIDQLPRPLVFTNGVYDLLHPGHVQLIAQARSLGRSLVLALNSDASVRTLAKGEDRPICTLEDRMRVAGALKGVDLVTWFEQPTPIELILAIRPEVLVKGGDWALKDIVGAQEVLGWGGQVHAIPFVHSRSTTGLLERIRSTTPPPGQQR